ncbi:MAG: nucleotide-binding domain containing protein, partial [Akkermansiaceae bacterium]|nr:nucleotide-binding domain containing protein [Akkermansiaceae bacterium]
LALLKSDRRFIIRSASSFVQSLAGIPSRPPLEPWQLQDLEPNPNGGLIIIGSETSKTENQLNHLLKNAPALTAIKLSIPDIINSTFNLKSTIADVQTAMTSGQNVVLFTSRRNFDSEDGLKITHSISQALIDIVQGIRERPSFLVAEGAITSFAIATDALGVKKAQVLGQIIPGVPVWTIGNETLHPGLAYVIFPSNLGGADALTLAVEKFAPVL